MSTEQGEIDFIRVPHEGAVLAQAAGKAGRLVWEPGSPWLAISLESLPTEFIKTPEALEQWSRVDGEVLHLSWCDANGPSLWYDHWRAGACVRSLQWDMALVEQSGTPAAWESTLPGWAKEPDEADEGPGLHRILDAIRTHHDLPRSAFGESVSAPRFQVVRSRGAFQVATTDGAPGAFLLHDRAPASGVVWIVAWCLTVEVACAVGAQRFRFSPAEWTQPSSG